MFVDKLDGHLESITYNNSNKIIMGANINADVGCHNDKLIEDYGKVMGPNGLHKHNSKGELLLGIYLALRFRVMNTYFIRKDNNGPHQYGTWTNRDCTHHATKADTHMFDVIVCSASMLTAIQQQTELKAIIKQYRWR
jgi:hypothetical protein